MATQCKQASGQFLDRKVAVGHLMISGGLSPIIFQSVINLSRTDSLNMWFHVKMEEEEI